MTVKISEQRTKEGYEITFFTDNKSLFRKARILLGELVSKEKEQRNMNIMLDSTALMPTRGHATDAGLDLLSPRDAVIPARGSAIIDTGVHVELPNGTAGFLKSKSGLNVKHGITSEGVIDVGYTGSIVCKLYNNSNDDYKIKCGDKITQLVIVKIETPNINIIDKLNETERGEGGFGSTGR